MIGVRENSFLRAKIARLQSVSGQMSWGLNVLDLLHRSALRHQAQLRLAPIQHQKGREISRKNIMEHVDLPKFPTRPGYMTEKIQRDYIQAAVAKQLLPTEAHRMADILSLTASSDVSKPIQFWQLYSVLGQDPILEIVQSFYQRVFEQDDWFRSVFERVGGINHHINTQASMWIDVMGGGPYYHGAEFRLNFHHTHNAMQLMNDKGAELWSQLMLEALDASPHLKAADPRVRTSINTFLSFFMGKYADAFSFENRSFFAPTNPTYRRRIDFMKMTEQAIEALSDTELAEALAQQGVDVNLYQGKAAKVSKALMM